MICLEHQVPPCIKASAAFLSPLNHTIESVTSYSRWSEGHRHIKPKAVHLPAYGAVIMPYRWMLRESGLSLRRSWSCPSTPKTNLVVTEDGSRREASIRT